MSVKNVDLIKAIITDIEEKPSKFSKGKEIDNDFVALFGNVETNQDLRGITLVEPHNVNTFLGALYDRVLVGGIVDGLKVSNEFEFMRGKDMTYAGTFSRTHVDTFEENKEVFNDINKSNSPIPTYESNVKKCYSSTPKKIIIPFTFSEEELQEAFYDETGINDLLLQFKKKATDTGNLDIRASLEDIIIGDLEENETRFYSIYIDDDGVEKIGYTLLDYLKNVNNNFQDTTTVLPVLSTEGETPLIVGKGYDYTYYINLLKRIVIKYACAMARPNNTFSVGDSDGKFKTSLPKGEGVLYINELIYTALNLDEDKFFGDKENYGKYFSKIVTMQNLAKDDVTMLFLIADANIIEYRIMLEKTLNWTNPKGLYTNYFSHLWYSTLVDPYLSSCMLKLKEV